MLAVAAQRPPGAEIILTQKIGPKLTVFVQCDYGQEDNAGLRSKLFGKRKAGNDMEQSPEVKLASKGKRFASGVIDMLLIPIVIGVGVGIIFFITKANQSLQMVFMVGLNIIWLIIRDTVGSPGRAMVRIRLQKTDGASVGLGTAIGRNIHLMIPLVLVVGYLVEFISLLATGRRVADRWAHTVVVEK